MKKFIPLIAVCLGLRLFLALMAKYYLDLSYKYLIVLYLLIAGGMMNAFYMQKSCTGKASWWNKIRLLHALLYVLFAVSTLQGKTYGWVFLVVDVVVGFVAFMSMY